MNLEPSLIETNNENFVSKYKRKIIPLFAIFIMIFSDFYYGYTDSSCIIGHENSLPINIKDYLLLSGLITLNMFISLFVSSFLLTVDMNIGNDLPAYFGIFMIIIVVLIIIFNILLNITGAIIFWFLMDTSGCNQSVYNYVFISLIYKLCLNSREIWNYINKKKEIKKEIKKKLKNN